MQGMEGFDGTVVVVKVGWGLSSEEVIGTYLQEI